MPSSDSESLPAKHGSIWHPEKSWIDMLVSFLFGGWLMPLHKLSEHPPSSESSHHVAKIQKTMLSMSKQGLANKSQCFHKWSKTVGEIVHSVQTIPRRQTILKDFGLTEQAFEDDREDVEIQVFFPASLLDDPVEGEVSDYGCVPLEGPVDFKTIVKDDVPLVVYFHGGGLTIGVAMDGSLITLVDDFEKPCVLVSVEYSLAPDYVFPTPVIEALSAVTFFIDQGFKVHLAGISAGGYLSIVSGMECVRMYPESILSIAAFCPMLDPACDSLSFYMHSNGYYVSTEWIKWCWQCYLELPASNKDDDEAETTEDALAANSNRTTWQESKWKNSPLERLCKPVVDTAETNIPILISTNRADPLCSEGVDYVNALKAKGANVRHLDHSGSHFLGTTLDAAALAELKNAWSSILF